MNWYNFFKFLHIASVIMMVGGIFARQIVRAVAKKSDDVKAVASLTQVAHRLDTAMVIPGSNMVMLFGIVVAILLKWPIFGFLQGSPKNWLLVSNLLLVMSIILVPAIFLPHNKKVQASLQAAVTQGRVTPELRALLEDQTNQRAHYAEQIIVLVIAALMVLKPF